jgi:hypothetical protein
MTWEKYPNAVKFDWQVDPVDDASVVEFEELHEL